MKIAFITYNIFSQGGVQRVVTNLSNELAKSHEVEIICTVDDNPIDSELYGLDINKINTRFKKDNSKIVEKAIRKIIKEINYNFRVLNNPKYNRILGNLLYPKSLRDEFIEYINENKYDIVIGVEGYFSLLLGLISDDIDAKTIGWHHNSFDAYLEMKCKRYYYNMHGLFKYAIPRLDSNVVLTEYDREKYKKNLQIESEVIYNPKSFSSEKTSDFKRKRFISVGRLERAKGFDLLIDSFNIFSKKNKDWTLEIIGEGPERELLQNKIDKYNLNERIHLLGSKNNIKDFYTEASIYLSSSRWEGLPLVLIEAMECGLPIISFDYPAAKEIIKDRNGILVRSSDIYSFSDNMYLLANDYERMRTLGGNNRIDVEKYNKDIIISQWNQLIQNNIK